jgi:MoaA/NifB/PqqE/SkfB family radical SAM enzyme
VYAESKQKYGIILDKKQDWQFFLNNKGEFELHKVCAKCKNRKECGQSCRCLEVICKNQVKENK